jgi:glucose/arabinose dehydrogenase
MRTARIHLALALCIFTAYPSIAQLQVEPAFPSLSFTRPVELQHAGDGTNRLFVVEQAGVIKVFENAMSTTSSSVFLNITDRVNDSGNEEGLLGLAFHPNYETNGYFYVDYTASNPRRTVISRFSVSAANPDSALKNSEFIIIEIPINLPNNNNHNGGKIAFGADGFLYIGPGDGGSGGDPMGNGQNLQSLLGKVLRIDVDNPSAGKNYGIPNDNPFAGNTAGNKEEIYAYGLRNPWRFSFDPVTNQLWLGDVGQGRREEVDIIENGKNYGWNRMEGNLCYPSGTPCDIPGLVKPIWDYPRSEGQSITGGYVYRGANVPELVGAYVYADYVSGRIWSLRYDGVNPPQNSLIIDTSRNIASFGVDQNNELYICAFDGKIYRFKPTITSTDPGGPLPVSPQLAQNYPNPFAPLNSLNGGITTITYQLPQEAFVELSVYNLNGQLVRTLTKGSKPAGKNFSRWDGTDEVGNLLPNGVYLYRLKVRNENVATRRIVFLK